MKTQILHLKRFVTLVLCLSLFGPILWGAVTAEANATYRIAILPTDLRDQAHTHTSLINKAIKDSFANDSSVDLQSYLSQKRLKAGGKNFKLNTKNLWYKKGFFSSRYQPKLDYVSAIGKSLQVDAVVMYSISVGTRATDYIHTYLIDIATTKEYYKTQSTETFSGIISGKQEGYGAIISTTQKALAAFKADRPRPSLNVAKKAPSEAPKVAQAPAKPSVSPARKPVLVKPVAPQVKPTKPSRFALNLQVTPSDSQVELLDSNIPYRRGLTLAPGRYTIQVTRKGYKPLRKTVAIQNNDVALSLRLEAHTYAFTVNPTPAASSVRILNIAPKYTPGMKLRPGQYDVQVTHDNYMAKRQWVEIEDGPVTLDIALEPAPPQLRRYPLLVNTTPKNSRVTLLNAKTPYRPNVALPAGSYDILVERKGYREQRQTITIADQPVQLDVTLELDVYALTIDAVPATSRIRILNIAPKYTPGMMLAPGRYRVRVDHPGYQPKEQWVQIEASPVHTTIDLALQTYALTVNAAPADSRIQLLNHDTAYQPGIALPPGTYEVQVERDGYQTKQQSVTIRNRDAKLNVALELQTYALTIQAKPAQSSIRILNIGPKYTPGMQLPPGDYDVLVEHQGYQAQRQQVTITSSPVTLDIDLAAQTYALAIQTQPQDSTVTLRNIAAKLDLPYRPGLELPAGQYEVTVARAGYQTKRQSVTIGKRAVSLSIALELQTYALTIDTLPRDSAVRLLNIASKYTPGMKLPPGDYEVAVTRAGYIEKRQRLTISDGPVTAQITLTSQTYAFTVKATPKESTVTLLDTDIAYTPGVALSPGPYKVLVEHAGYQPRQEVVNIKDQEVTLEVSLTLQRYQLHVNAVPADSTIILLNSKQRFTQGMALPPGEYDLQVARKGYFPLEQTVKLDRSNVTLDIALEKIGAPVPVADTTAPKIQITSHDLNSDIKVAPSVSQVTIWGTARDASGVSKVVVNGTKTLLDQDGNFAANIKLREGENNIRVVAEDNNGIASRVAFAIQRPAASRPRSRRSALIIGNSAYRTAPLQNPSNDATDIAEKLEQLGFNVTLVRDATHRQMEEAVDKFSRRLRRGGVGLFYYAGHGLQVAGQNYLLPVDANLQRELDVKYQAVNAGWVLETMADSGNELNMAILDACRDNPFARSWRSGQRGLAVVQAARGMLIAYATEPGGVAEEGSGRNGTYTKHLLRYITKPGWAIERVFKQTRISVMRETKGKQIPWESSSLLGDFYFLDK